MNKTHFIAGMGKEQPMQKSHFLPGVMRKTVGLSYKTEVNL